MTAPLVVILLIALAWLWPAKYDPSIRFKEWLNRDRGK
jgi:hypothetical protein